MLQSLKFIVGLLLGGYLLICLALYFNQRSLIYHPQPRQLSQLPVVQLFNEGLKLQISLRSRASDYAVIYLGGNAEDVSASVPLLSLAFPDRAIYALHYRGYGGSEGQPSEAALYADALALEAMVRKQHNKITVIGRSLGSGVACYLASQRTVERVVLVTPYSSISDIAAAQFPWIPVRWLLKDGYDSVYNIKQVKSPVHVIAAQHDEVIPAWSTQRLFEAIEPSLRQQDVIQGVGHNTISANPRYAELLSQ
jgi:uncharacterized protein